MGPLVRRTIVDALSRTDPGFKYMTDAERELLIDAEGDRLGRRGAEIMRRFAPALAPASNAAATLTRAASDRAPSPEEPPERITTVQPNRQTATIEIIPVPEKSLLERIREYPGDNDTIRAAAYIRDTRPGGEHLTYGQLISEAGKLVSEAKTVHATVISASRSETDHPALHMPGRNRVEKCMAFVKLTPRGKTLSHDELWREGVEFNRKLLNGAT